MLYIHAFSPIEESIYKLLAAETYTSQVDCKLIYSADYIERIAAFTTNDVLVYSFQQLDYYKHLHTFRQECEWVDIIVDFAVRHKYKKIILLTYPGAYPSSDNLFLQHKGIIQQKFVDSGIPCVMLHLQAIVHPQTGLHNLHSLFFDKTEKKYIIPQRSNMVVYSVTIDRLVQVISHACQVTGSKSYDVFDDISDLSTFISKHTKYYGIQKLAPIYLYVKSFAGKYQSPTMLELFLRTTVPMHNYQTNKDVVFHLV